MDAGQQLGEAKRLGQVIVSSERQPVDHVLKCPRCGQHQDPGLGLLAAHGAAYVVAVHAWEVAVEHQHVVSDHARLEERLLAVRREVDRHPLLPQAARDRVPESQLVLGDQHADAANMNRPT